MDRKEKIKFYVEIFWAFMGIMFMNFIVNVFFYQPVYWIMGLTAGITAVLTMPIVFYLDVIRGVE